MSENKKEENSTTKNDDSKSEKNELDKIPEKSRSLRAKSIQKRLATQNKSEDFAELKAAELSRENNSTKAVKKPRNYSSRKATLSRYRRKTANAKERDRMRTVNEAFDRLKDSLPAAAIKISEENSHHPSINSNANNGNQGPTKVMTLRFAIDYIRSLERLIEDSNKGILDPSFYGKNDFEEEENEETAKAEQLQQIQPVSVKSVKDKKTKKKDSSKKKVQKVKKSAEDVLKAAKKKYSYKKKKNKDEKKMLTPTTKSLDRFRLKHLSPNVPSGNWIFNSFAHNKPSAAVMETLKVANPSKVVSAPQPLNPLILQKQQPLSLNQLRVHRDPWMNIQNRNRNLNTSLSDDSCSDVSAASPTPSTTSSATASPAAVAAPQQVTIHGVLKRDNQQQLILHPNTVLLVSGDFLSQSQPFVIQDLQVQTNPLTLQAVAADVPMAAEAVEVGSGLPMEVDLLDDIEAVLKEDEAFALMDEAAAVVEIA